MRVLVVMAACMLVVVDASAQAAALDEDRVAAWLAGYEAAWESKDAEAAAALFTSNARYHETPHAEPFRGRDGIAEYWTTVTAGQSDIDFEAEVLAVEGDIGIAHWRAAFEAGGEQVRLDGVFVLEFDADGLCVELREWWHAGP